MVIELLDFDRLAVHRDVQKTVDLVLRGIQPRPEIRTRLDGKVEVVQHEESVEVDDPAFNTKYPSLAHRPPQDPESKLSMTERPASNGDKAMLKLYPYGIARTRLEKAIRERRAPIYIVNDIHHADAILAIRTTYASKPKKLRDVSGRPIPTIVIKSNTYGQILQALDDLLKQSGETRDVESEAMEEAMRAIDAVLQSGKPQELTPQGAPIRKMQHQLAESRRLASEAVGEEPHRRLRILPTRLS